MGSRSSAPAARPCASCAQPKGALRFSPDSGQTWHCGECYGRLQHHRHQQGQAAPCSLCKTTAGAWRRERIWRLERACYDCWFKISKLSRDWSEEDLVLAMRTSAERVAVAFQLTNMLRRRYNSKVRHKRLYANYRTRGKLRPLLRARKMRELGYAVS